MSLLLLFNPWRAAAAAAGTVSSFTGTAVLEQGEVNSGAGVLSSFTGAASVRQGERFAGAAQLTSFSGAALEKQGEVLVDAGTLTGFTGAVLARQGELAAASGAASSFTGSGALLETAAAPSFAAAGIVSSFQAAAVAVETAPPQRTAGKKPTKSRLRPSWADGPHPVPARTFNAFIAFGTLSSFSGDGGMAAGAGGVAQGALPSFVGAAVVQGGPFLEDEELILLALAA